MVWKEVLMAFNIPQQKKSWLLKVANTLWRRFKSDLTTRHLFDKDKDLCLSPPVIYTHYISQDQWNKFISTRQSEEFQETSEEHRHLSLKNKYSYRGSRKGYARISAELKRELDTSTVSRADVWKKARRQTNGDFAPEVQEVIKIMDNLSAQVSSGQIQILERQDILSLALEKKEHPGRVRGVGQYVTMREYYGRASRVSSISEESVRLAVNEIEEKMGEKLKLMQERHTNSQAQIQEMQGFIVKLLQEVSKNLPDLSIPIPQFASWVPQELGVPSVDNISVLPETNINLDKGKVMPNESHVHSSTNAEFVPCALFWPNKGQQVATGSVCRSTSGVRLHNRALDPDCYKVQVITPMLGKGGVELPRPTDEACTIFEAIGSFVAWPTALVSTTMASLKTNKEIQSKLVKKRVGSNGFTIHPSANATFKTLTEVSDKIRMVTSKTMVKPGVMTSESDIHLPLRRDMVDSYTKKMPNFFWYHPAMSNSTLNIRLSDAIMGYEHSCDW